MADGINIVDFVHGVAARKRGRACAVMTREYASQREWAVKLAGLTDSEHIDLLDLFHKDEQLSGNLAVHTPQALFALLRERATTGITIVSGIEFLKATWSGDPRSANTFASLVETWADDPALVFVMQYDKAIAERPGPKFRDYTFVVDQRETFAL